MKQLSKSDYVKELLPASKVLLACGVIEYDACRQSRKGGCHRGVFSFVLYNPLTLVFLLVIALFLLAAAVIDACLQVRRELLEFVRDGVYVEI